MFFTSFLEIQLFLNFIKSSYQTKLKFKMYYKTLNLMYSKDNQSFYTLLGSTININVFKDDQSFVCLVFFYNAY